MDEQPDIWTEEEVRLLNESQARREFHPYTCPGGKPECEHQRELIATRKGWVCQCGEYRQYWVHGVGENGPG